MWSISYAASYSTPESAAATWLGPPLGPPAELLEDPLIG